MPAVPDIVGAFLEHMLALPETSALTSTRISGVLRVRSSNTDASGWQMPTFAIVVRKVPGPSSDRPGNVPVIQESLQIDCYGPTAHDASRLWRTLRAEMFPDPPAAQGFIAAHCAVTDIQQSGTAAPVPDEKTGYPRIVATWLVRYCERAV